MSETDKKRPLEESPELAQVRAFAETAFPRSLKRMPAERVAKLVGELSLRWSTESHHVPTVAGALHAQPVMKIEVEHMLDLIVAWEDINSCKYDLAQGKFVKTVVKNEGHTHGKSGDKKKSAHELEKKLAELE